MPRWRSALLTPFLVGCLAACGGSTDARPTGERDSLRDAAESAAAGASSYVPLTTKTFGARVAAALRDQETVHVTGDLSGQATDVWMRTGGARSTSLRGTMGGSEVLLVDGRYFTRADAGSRWAELPAEFSAMMGSSLEELSPARIADEYARSLEAVTYRGRKRVDGRPLHVYALRLDAGYALAKAREQAEAIGADATSITAGDLPRTTLVVFLDPRDLMRRSEVTMGDTTVVTEYADWGRPVDIAVPAADQVEQLVR